MTSATKSQRNHTATDYEVVGATGSEQAVVPTVTEYESPNGLDLNVTDPNAESTNAAAQTALAPGDEVALSELGLSGGSEAGVVDFDAPDAIFGSYPELSESQEVIIGADNRVRVNPTTGYPWRAICALRITAANGSRYIGTGWLIGPRTVVTAGHCVFMHQQGGWARSIEVIPGLNDAARPFGTFAGNALRSVTGWTSSQNREYDYGAIILPPSSRPGDQTGYFGLAVRPDAFLRSAALNLSGYPGDKGGSQQWFMAQQAKAVAPRVITYDIDTFGGQSGSPVWVIENGQRYGVGVHTNGAASGNSATRINTEVYNNLLNWKAQGA